MKMDNSSTISREILIPFGVARSVARPVVFTVILYSKKLSHSAPLLATSYKERKRMSMREEEKISSSNSYAVRHERAAR